MSTRAVYTFKDDYHKFHVCGHCDGYPSGAAEKLMNMVKFAWPLPRFEAMDCSAAFIAGNKIGGGEIYNTNGKHGDLAFRYTITAADGSYIIEALQIGIEKPIFKGTLEKFVEWAKLKENMYGIEEDVWELKIL